MMSVVDTKPVGEKIEKKIVILRKLEKEQRKLYNRLSNVRLLVFLTGILIGGFYYQDHRLPDAYLLLLIVLLLFAFFFL